MTRGDNYITRRERGAHFKGKPASAFSFATRNFAAYRGGTATAAVLMSVSKNIVLGEQSALFVSISACTRPGAGARALVAASAKRCAPKAGRERGPYTLINATQTKQRVRGT